MHDSCASRSSGYATRQEEQSPERKKELVGWVRVVAEEDDIDEFSFQRRIRLSA